ncbi:MAG: hypothetical protein WAV72_08085 [Bradyrhizobium sp.]
MALHRDIFWVGRQWAVTGYGVQAVDPKLKGQFDVEVSRLWEDGLADRLHRDGWLNREDFDKALSVARARYPEPPRKAAPLAPPAASGPATSPAPPEPGAPRVMESAPAEPPKPVGREFAMRVQGWPAKFVRPWRARVRR